MYSKKDPSESVSSRRESGSRPDEHKHIPEVSLNQKTDRSRGNKKDQAYIVHQPNNK